MAHRELLAGIRELLKAIRLLKNSAPAVHTGVLGVLASIDETGREHGCHVKDLAARNALDPSTISRAVAGLVRHGLVERTADPADGRASVLALTVAGRRTLERLHGWYDDRLADALADWSDADVTAFTAMLQRFCNDLESVTSNLEAAR